MQQIRKSTCHCGSVKLEIRFDKGLENIRRCDCSLCRRKGYVMAAVPTSHLKIIQGRDQLSCYQWNTKIAKHYFCKNCGIHTHHQRRSNPNQYGINIACIDSVNPYKYKEVPIGNGELNDSLPTL
ncbi:GFA family protein [Piscirickettsia litoralis]|uniref:Aldehyde-activating protein n=1 Tax=Piscirickettsia litoralis TaxID=1891921 RepID=A0ABX2ZYY1_9GAMM|nr:GFA family protein [Piscirickettsia litoralis]ODN41777.1 aldehyde-activating protein [Piscirickettsia litoralis]